MTHLTKFNCTHKRLASEDVLLACKLSRDLHIFISNILGCDELVMQVSNEDGP